MGWKRGKLSFFMLMFQVIFIVLFAIFVEYHPNADARTEPHSLDVSKGGKPDLDGDVDHYYAMFQDVHVMMFIGFGYLMTFLKRYCYSSVSLCMVLAAFVIQWSTLVLGFLHMHHGKIQVDLTSMLLSEFAAAAVLITFGAAQGKLSPLQLIVASMFEIAIFAGNEYLGLEYFHAVDVGGSMFVHVFGAYFGIALARVLYTHDIEKVDEELQGSVYNSDLFSMIGTIFLWMFWPSFNSALAPGDDQHRAIINTYYALSASCVVAFLMSALVDDEDKFEMEHIQNATLAGGVAVGTSADLMIHPWGALVIGSLAGTLSVVGFKYLQPFLAKKMKLYDTCGVNNLHGMPGIMAGIIGAIVIALVSEEQYGLSMYQIFPAMAPIENSTELARINLNLTIPAGLGRTSSEQAGYQMLALVCTIAIAIVGGVVTGFILKIPIWDQPYGDSLFDDEDYFAIPNHGFPGGLRDRRKLEGNFHPEKFSRRHSHVYDNDGVEFDSAVENNGTSEKTVDSSQSTKI